LGGVGESGIGAYHGKMTFETFSYKRSILIRNFMILPDLFLSIRNPPYTDYKATSLAKFLEPTGSVIPADLWMASKHLASHIGCVLRGQSQKVFTYTSFLLTIKFNCFFYSYLVGNLVLTFLS